MQNVIKYVTSLVVLLFLSFCVDKSSEDNTDKLFERFVNPPAEARPFVRWWWNGNRVEEDELMRELDVMNEAGIGGVEINPIRMPIKQDLPGIEPLEWLSPEWNKAVKTTSEWAKKNGMLTDMIVGSGWPFGGEFLEPGEIVQRVLLNQKELTGSSVFTAKANEILNEVPKGYSENEFENVLRSRILFMRLVPEHLENVDESKDVMSSLGEDGKIRIEVPEGNYRLFIGIWQEGHRRVTHGAPGADGPVLDHLNGEAVQKYLDRLSVTLEKEFGAELGEYLRALFCDSIELAGANWTTGFLEKFYEICGYRLEPYLPFVIYRPWEGYDDEISMSSGFEDVVRKVRYDYNRVLVTIFLDNFTKTFKNWSNDHGALSRYQAYGLPWLVGLSEGYMIPDIPESNNWLFHNVERQGSVMWNKYASSSGHIGGKPIISSEAMTNTSGVFKASLEYIKQADDKNFITGITHSVLHGYSYSPPEAGFPGWLRYGAYFNEQNTWWPYFNLWTDYNARLSTVFQSSKPLAEVVIVGPTADVWSQNGLNRYAFNKTPWYVYQIWKPFSQNGITADYINEKFIQDADFDKGKLVLGEMKYDLLILTDVESILPETARKIKEYAEAGGKIIFTDRLPSRSPSLVDYPGNDSAVEEMMKKATDASPEKVVLMDGPASEDQLMSWIKDLIEKIELEPPVRIAEPSSDVYQVHYSYGNSDIFFFTNQNYEESRKFSASFKDAEGFPWRWDPETGTRAVYPYGDDPQNFNVELEPLESLLLVFENRKGQQEQDQEVDESTFFTMESQWNVRFIPHINDEEFQMNFSELPEIGDSENERLNSFAGVIEYKTTFETDKKKDMIIDLGEVYGISEVYLNGKNLGTRWYGNHRFPLKGSIEQGENELKIKLTTTLFNYSRTQEDNPEISRWIRSQEPIPSGIRGPVRVYY